MKLILRRQHVTPNATIGGLFHDETFLCYTLEDAVREAANTPVQDWKVKGATAIPRGRYDVLLTYSNRFKVIMPQLMNVPGFEGIRIHTGNTSADTEGCILVGATWDGKREFIGNSRDAYAKLFARIQESLNAGDPVSITIS